MVLGNRFNEVKWVRQTFRFEMEKLSVKRRTWQLCSRGGREVHSSVSRFQVPSSPSLPRNWRRRKSTKPLVILSVCRLLLVASPSPRPCTTTRGWMMSSPRTAAEADSSGLNQESELVERNEAGDLVPIRSYQEEQRRIDQQNQEQYQRQEVQPPYQRKPVVTSQGRSRFVWDANPPTVSPPPTRNSSQITSDLRQQEGQKPIHFGQVNQPVHVVAAVAANNAVAEDPWEQQTVTFRRH